MIRVVAMGLCLITAGAFATSPALRSAAISQLRSLAEPLFEQGEATEPHFDAFYAGMVEALPPQERAERALELAINRYTGAAEYCYPPPSMKMTTCGTGPSIRWRNSAASRSSTHCWKR